MTVTSANANATAPSGCDIDNKNTKIWRERLSETILPYRMYIVLFQLIELGVTAYIGMDRLFPYGTGVTTTSTAQPGSMPCEIPDLCFFGYTPLEVLDWYESIGSEGRLLYLCVVAFDLLVIVPLYAMVLFQELYLVTHSLPGHFSATVVCLPFLAAFFDWIETVTHGYGVIAMSLRKTHYVGWGLLVPPESWLKLASVCTRSKWVIFGVSFAAIVSCWGAKLFVYLVVALFRAPPKRKNE